MQELFYVRLQVKEWRPSLQLETTWAKAKEDMAAILVHDKVASGDGDIAASGAPNSSGDVEPFVKDIHQLYSIFAKSIPRREAEKYWTWPHLATLRDIHERLKKRQEELFASSAQDAASGAQGRVNGEPTEEEPIPAALAAPTVAALDAQALEGASDGEETPKRRSKRGCAANALNCFDVAVNDVVRIESRVFKESFNFNCRVTKLLARQFKGMMQAGPKKGTEQKFGYGSVAEVVLRANAASGATNVASGAVVAASGAEGAASGATNVASGASQESFDADSIFAVLGDMPS